MDSLLKLLLVSEKEYLLSSLSDELEAEGFDVTVIQDGLQALRTLESEHFDIILCDNVLSRLDGLSFIHSAKKKSLSSYVLMFMDEFPEDLAISYILAGAYDCLSLKRADYLLSLRKLVEREGLAGRLVSKKTGGVSGLVSSSEAMQPVLEMIGRLSRYDTTVLILGESGTGKEVSARAIHQNSARAKKPFIAINCGAIPENLIESELFGHEKGSFTDATKDKVGLFEEADGGTVFLDEIGEMPLAMQVKLLRVLQEKQVLRVGGTVPKKIDVRVIAATLRDLEEDVKAGRFREDLLYRLNVVSLKLPPLRERQGDIEELSRFFIKKHNKRLGLNIRGIAPEALAVLNRYPWPGNVRELENCIEHAMVLSDSGEITLATIPNQIKKISKVKPIFSVKGLSIKENVRELEISLIEKALRKTHGNRTHAAKLLEISHRALLYKIKEYGLGDVPQE